MKRHIRRTAASAAWCLAAVAALAAPGPGEATLVSGGAGDVSGNADTYFGSFSNSGRFVALSTVASNYGSVDGNEDIDIYLRDLVTGETELVSRDGAGAVGSAGSNYAILSANGRRVLYHTGAANLAGGTANGSQLLLHDRTSGTTTQVTVAPNGDPADGHTDEYTCRPLSGNGRWAVFGSAATNLVAGDGNGKTDVFLADLKTGVIERISAGIAGEADGDSRFASISPNGRWVTFISRATNLVEGGTDGSSHVFLYDTRKRSTVLASRATNGDPGNDDSPDGYFGNPVASNNGRFVAFLSSATNLDPDSPETKGFNDVFLRDMRTGVTRRISEGPAGAEADGAAYDIAITPNGRLVAFDTDATNMIDAEGGIAGDAILHDVRTGTNRRLLEALAGGRPTGSSGYISANGLSPNGRWMAVSSPAADVVEGDGNGKVDVFRVDLR